ncbi:MAG TPA: hypothetical protein VG798_05495, partial [Rhizomicrobium sp.]|nr:hypothetical protein [Rhizomicrobium sp.]
MRRASPASSRWRGGLGIISNLPGQVCGGRDGARAANAAQTNKFNPYRGHQIGKICSKSPKHHLKLAVDKFVAGAIGP